MFVKVCGLTREADVDAALDAGADAVGFVLAESPRQVTLARARQLVERVGHAAMTVAVVVDPTDDDVAHLSEFDGVQVHGHRPFVPRSLQCICATDGGVVGYRDGDWVLVDHSRGRGVAPDWSALDLSSYNVPVIVAGGLTPYNVGDVIAAARPYGVDVSSGVETQPGIKDAALVRRFVSNAKSA